MLFDIGAGRGDAELSPLFGVPMAILPEVVDCAAGFGIADRSHLGAAIAVRGIADDQQAAIIGQACFAPGMVTCTHRTGCFALLNTARSASPRPSGC